MKMWPSHPLFELYQERLTDYHQALNPQCWVDLWNTPADWVYVMNDQAPPSERAYRELKRLHSLIKYPGLIPSGGTY